MDYGTIVDEVVAMTGRPDKESYIRNVLVNTVVRYLAGLQDSFNDLDENVEAVDSTATLLNLTLPDRFRKVAYLRPQPYAVLLSPIKPHQAIVNGKELVNCYYIAGNTAIIRLQDGKQTSNLARGYYLYPAALTLATDSNWVTNDYGDLVVNLCAAQIFRTTGDKQSATNLEDGQFGTKARIENIKAQDTTGGVSRILGSNPVG